MTFDEIEFLIKELKLVCPRSQRPWEWTTLILFILAGQRFNTKNWIQFKKKHDESFHKNLRSAENGLSNLQIKEFLQSRIETEIFQQNYFFYFQKVAPQDSFWKSATSQRWKHIPSHALESLQAWALKKYNLILSSSIISPEEMMNLQAQGQRIVTVFESKKDLEQVHEHHRDAFLFTVHDLEHANHFFCKPQNHQQQKKLIELMKSTFAQNTVFRSWVAQDLQKEFDYLISDMNTHPWHMYLTLQQLLLKSHKIQLGHEQSKHLPFHDELQFQDKIRHLLSQWKMSYPPNFDSKFNQSLLE